MIVDENTTRNVEKITKEVHVYQQELGFVCKFVSVYRVKHIC